MTERTHAVLTGNEMSSSSLAAMGDDCASRLPLTLLPGKVTSSTWLEGSSQRAGVHHVRTFRFGPFVLDGARRMLFREGQPVPLVPKALELLELLIEERERTLSKSELLDRLWPDTVVAENNLSVTMSALRKALGESAARPRYLQTLSRRGYRFVEAPEEASARDAAPLSSSPARLRRSVEKPESSRARVLVGREFERERLDARLERAYAGEGHVVLITGEPGIGKTALCESFLSSLANNPREVTVMRGRSLEQFGRGEAYLPWLEAWSALLAGEKGDLARSVLRRVAPSWCREFPSLFGADSAPPLDDGRDVTRLSLLREMGDALARLAHDVPLVLVLEDLHWADAASCDVLRWICQRSRGQRWLVLGTFRSVEAGLLNAPLETLRREALAHGDCEEMRLGALSPAHVAACVAAHFATNDFPNELVSLLHRKTEGHPLFLTRLLSFLVQRGDIVDQAGVWRLARPLDRLELEAPEDVRAMVRRKLDSLDDDARRALAYASISGNEFSSRVLAALLEIDQAAVEERLQPLCSLHRLVEIIGEESWPDGQISARYRFAHALYQNELYASLVSSRRVLLHRRTADVLLSQGAVEPSGADRARLAVTLAIHCERGREFSRAIEFLELAGRNAHRLCAYAEEERHYNRALELCEQLPEPARLERRALLLQPLGWALYDAGHTARAERVFQEMLEHAERARSSALECEALNALSAISFLVGRLDLTRAHAERLRRCAAASNNGPQERYATACIAGCVAGLGRFDEAFQLSQEVLPGAERENDKRALACLYVNFGWAHAFRSEFAEAEASYTRAFERWVEISSIMAAECLHALGWIRAHRGRPSDALDSFVAAIDLMRQRQCEFRLARLPDGIGWMRRELGDFAGASAHHRQGLERARARGARFFELSFAIEHARDSIELGDWAEAEHQLGFARTLLEAGVLDVFPCFVRRAELKLSTARGAYFLARGDAESAKACAETLRKLAALDPSREHQALALEQLARAHATLGELSDARQRLREAAAIVQQYPMPFIAWRVHALAWEVCERLGEVEAAAASRAHARQLVHDLTRGVRDRALAAHFLALPSVARLRGGDALAS